MRWLITKIALAIFLSLAVLLSVTVATVGYSNILTMTAVVVGSFLLLTCYALLLPLEKLVALTPRVNPASQAGDEDEDFFHLLRDAIESRQQQLERQSMQQAEAQGWFEAVLSGMDEGIVAIDATGKILFLNQAASKILLLDESTAIGASLIGLTQEEAVRNATQEALKSCLTVTATFETQAPMNSRTIRLRVAPLAMLGQPVSGMTLVLQDISEIVKAETIRRDFVANASHELKTPLSAIKAIAETLLMGAIYKQPENLRFVQQIDQQADVLSRQVHDLLQLARIESNLQAFTSEPVELAEICRESLSHYQGEAQQKGVTMVLNSTDNQDSQGCYVWADKDALRTVIDNLVSNAMRYSHQPYAEHHQAIVQVQLSVQPAHCVIEVIDNGIGIAPEYQSRIFERFFRVDTARSREQGGTGLGLSIVKHLVHSFDGRIEVESELGVGSAFRCIFPRFDHGPL